MRFQCKTALRNNPLPWHPTPPHPTKKGAIQRRHSFAAPSIMCIILRSFSKVLCRNLQFSFLLFAIIVCCSYCSYFLDSFVSLVTIVALLLFWFILFAHLEFALNVSMVIFCGRAMEGAGNASHRAGPGWIQLASTGDRTHDMRCSTCAPRMLGVHMLH